MSIIMFWIILSSVVAMFAKRRGRSAFIAFLFSLLLSPLVMFLIYVAIGESTRGATKRIRKEEEIRAQIRKELEG